MSKLSELGDELLNSEGIPYEGFDIDMSKLEKFVLAAKVMEKCLNDLQDHFHGNSYHITANEALAEVKRILGE